ncbi:histidine phosphatase family protein [Bacillus sp. sid0103]|uniref:histidine phosphatase family protein n=1 Tax=Bacillus sp. sid0103 TaxID=2856337 RepID=UPI001C466D68|nr:histidine phosphatase family protein [Bacillus sp. sid0103]MBV7504828.1 histidine phosphatase family protein [Bacillus sp. sid0103]
MEISLIRHGRSRFTDNKPISCEKFIDWMEQYDSHGVFEENSYPTETLEKIRSAAAVLTSDLKRSIESAGILNPNRKARINPLFRETELPTPSTDYGGLKLNPTIWAVLLWCLWFSGYSRNCESIGDAEARARRAAKVLIKYAHEHNRVALVGHGFFNSLIAKELIKAGWRGKKTTSLIHWDCTTYSFD